MTTVSSSRLIARGFLCAVVAAGCVSQGKYDTLEARNVELEQQNVALKQQTAAQSAEIASDEAEITRLQGAIKYTVESDLLFPSGSWEMSEDGKQILARMAKKLAPTQENKLVVNGYTDDAPIGPSLEEQGVTSNETLSQKRADAVKAFLVTQGVDPNMVIAVGHGEANPVAKNDTERGRSKNRRVELTLEG